MLAKLNGEWDLDFTLVVGVGLEGEVKEGLMGAPPPGEESESSSSEEMQINSVELREEGEEVEETV